MLLVGDFMNRESSSFQGTCVFRALLVGSRSNTYDMLAIALLDSFNPFADDLELVVK